MKKEYLKFKKYPHFDKRMSVRKAKRLLSNENAIKNHGFFPFIHYTIKSKKLENVDGKVYSIKEPKKREIYYSAHFDRYIYQYYAYQLGILYNEYVIKSGIDDCVGAYRINKGKCNIDFAYEMFEIVKSINNAIVIVGDFTGFFDNLDHQCLKRRLEIILDSKIDDNLYKIFKSLTKFKYVNIDDLYDYYTIRNKKRSEKYYMRKLNQLMTVQEFRKFIKEKNTVTGESYLKSNTDIFGIVQGSPMSGLLANIYMINFDEEMCKFAQKYDGRYLRYSDDFMLVLKKSNDVDLTEIYDKIQKFVNHAGKIELEKRKTNIYEYKNGNLYCINNSVFGTDNVSNIINFLGFSFNGVNVSIREKTLSKYFYKMNRSIKQLLRGKKNIKVKNIYDRFSFQGENKKNSRGNKGNFITYVERSSQIFKGETRISNVKKNSKQKVTERLGIIKSRNK